VTHVVSISTARSTLAGRATRRAAQPAGHPTWCVAHSGQGCLGAAVTMPESGLQVWLWAPTDGDARLVVDGPGGYAELPVVA
jgi:hypothetical protein